MISQKNFPGLVQNLGMTVVISTLLVACGGGGGGAAPSSADPGAANSLRGVVSKGIVSGATVCAYAITANGAQGSLIGSCVTSNAGGAYAIDIGTYTGPVLAQAKGGNYVNEATGTTVPLASSLNSVLSNATGGANALAITALTEVAVQNASARAGGLARSNIEAAIAAVQNNFGVPDIVGTMPVNAFSVPANATVAQKAYTLALATVSQYQNKQPVGQD